MRSRPVAKIVLLDEQCRIFLFRYENERPLGPGGSGPQSYWTTPGGGVEEGETFDTAARRELREETGVLTAHVGACIWRRRKRLECDGGMHLQDEHYFLSTVRARDLDVGACPERTCRAYGGCRWWHLWEIESSGETFFPEGLARLLARIVCGDVPAIPIDIEVTSERV
jgi:8-oxo-dGTP pyrophosphatase MutT (NUDIX family)